MGRFEITIEFAGPGGFVRAKEYYSSFSSIENSVGLMKKVLKTELVESEDKTVIKSTWVFPYGFSLLKQKEAIEKGVKKAEETSGGLVSWRKLV